MGLRLPQADLYFNQYTDTQLIARAQAVHDGLASVEGLALYTTPPVTPVDLLAGIATYKTKSAQAIKGSKAQTDAKTLAKKNLINALRADGEYVNQVVNTQFSAGSPIAVQNIRSLIYISGYRVSSDPTPAAVKTEGISVPIVKSAISKEPGKLYILLRQRTNGKRVIINRKKGRKLWSVRYRTSLIPGTVPVPAGEWVTAWLTSSSITLTGLDSAKSYDYQVAAVGGVNTKLNYDNPLNYTTIQSVVVT